MKKINEVLEEILELTVYLKQSKLRYNHCRHESLTIESLGIANSVPTFARFFSKRLVISALYIIINFENCLYKP